MLQIVFLCPFRLSGPRYGGSYRILGLASAFARAGHSVRVESFVVPAERWPRRWMAEGNVAIREHADWRGLASALGRVHLAPPVLPVALAARSNRHRLSVAPVDVAIYAYPWLWRAPQVQARVHVFDAHNCEADWYERDIAARPFGTFWRNFVRRAEGCAYREADRVWCVSPEDQQRLAAIYGERERAPAIIPSGAVPTIRRQEDERRKARQALGISPDAPVALFVGFRMRYNAEALIGLAAAQGRSGEKNPPLVLVAGSVSEILPKLPANFRVLGYQEDLAPLVAAADVAFNPTLDGSGSNTKLIELFARGLPVVTTEFGLRGFEALRPRLTVAPLEAFSTALESARGSNVDFPAELRWDSIVKKAEQDLRGALSSSAGRNVGTESAAPIQSSK